MQFGLKEEIIQAVQQVLEQNQHVDKALVFGSRAKGNYKEGSDIDLALKGDLNAKDVLELHGKLDALNLHYKFDLVNYKSISEPALKEHIDEVGMEMYSRWKEYNLGGILDKKGYIRGPFGSSLKRDEMKNKGIPVYEQRNAIYNSREFRFYIDQDKFEELKRFQVKTNDLIISCSGTVGKISIIRENDPKGIISQALLILRPDVSKVGVLFLYYFLSSKQGFELITQASHGSVQVNIAEKKVVESIRLKVPPVIEQTIITETLCALDDKIDLLNRQNKTLEQLAETLFRQWFVEDAEESWGIATLAEHTEVFRGLSYKGSGLTDSSNGLPMHNLNSVYEFGGYKSDGIKYYKGEYRERHLVNAGDIIVTNTEQGHEYRLIGFPGIVPSSFGTVGLFSQHIYKLVPLKDTYLTNQFLYYLLTTPSVREQIIGATNGSTVNMLAIDGLQRPEFKLPPKQQVKEFSAIITNYWKKKESNHSQIETLTKLRDTLLPKLMSGEIRVDLTDAELAKPVKNKKANIGQ